MAKITEISVSYGITKSFKKYEFLRLDVTVGARIENGDNPEEEYKKLFKEAREKIIRDAEIETEFLRNW